MAAIAKFISFDGGIAFSESVVKFQKRSGDAKLFPLSEIDSVSVRRPQQENRGFIRLQTKEGKLYRIFFDEDQYGQATAFKKQLDQQLAAAPAPEEEPAAAPEPVQPEPEPVRRPAARERRPVERPARMPERKPARDVEEEEEEPYDGNDGSGSVLRKWWFWLIVALLVIAIALAAVHLVISLRARAASSTSVHSTAITIPAAVDAIGTEGEGTVPAESPVP